MKKRPTTKRPVKKRAVKPKLAAFTAPVVVYPSVTIPQGNGSYLIQPGKPEILATEISTARFARETGMSQRNAVRLCEEGLVANRRLSPKAKSKYLIDTREIPRFRKLDGEQPLPKGGKP